MLFSSYPFILLFLPLFLLFWHLTSIFAPRRLPMLLLGVSLFFYGLWGLPFLLLLVLVAALFWIFGRVLSAPARGPFSRRLLLAIFLCLGLAPLLWFKYSWFIGANLALLFGGEWQYAPPGLPLGISFYTFIQIAWLVGVYRGELAPGGFLRHLLFTSCFFYVASGPIVRAGALDGQFAALGPLCAVNVARGISLFVLGAAKKIVLADSIAVYANAVFGAAEKNWPLTTPEAWLGSFCYTFQLYFDFSGYTDMALGLALLVGLRLPQNFDSPYKSTGIVDFWRRWHITLGLWLRDFLYIPLGGNRKGRARQYLNLFLTMLIGGAWHGAGWTYIIWGALHGLMLTVNHYFRALTKNRPPAGAFWRLLSILATFLCVNICWVVFRAPSLDCALAVYEPMFSLCGAPAYWPLEAADGLTRFLAVWLPNGYIDARGLLFVCACFFIVWALPNTSRIMRGDGLWYGWRPTRVWAAGLAFLLFAGLALLGRESTFLYFQF